MNYRRIHSGMLGVFLFGLAGCAGAATVPTPSHSPTPSGPTAIGGPVAYVLVTQLVRGQPTEQVVTVQGGKPLWSFTLPAAGSALSLEGDTLFVGAGDTVYALSTANGQKRWSTTGLGPHVTSLQSQGDVLFAVTGLGSNARQQKLAALDVSNGTIRWRLTPPLGLASWLIYGQTIYVIETGFPAQFIAVDPTTGTIQSQKPLQSGVLSGAVTAFLPADGSSLVLVCDQSIAVLTTTGTVSWVRQNTHNLGVLYLSGAIYSFYADQPAELTGGSQMVGLRSLNARDGSVLWDQKLASDDATYLAFQKSLTVGAITNREAYIFDGASFQNTQAWDLSGQSLWTIQGTKTFTVLAQDAQNIYLASAQGITALQGALGKKIWQVPTPGDVGGMEAVNNSIFGISKSNTSLYALNASTGQLIWTYNAYQLHGYIAGGQERP